MTFFMSWMYLTTEKLFCRSPVAPGNPAVNNWLVNSPVLFLLQRKEVFSLPPHWVDTSHKEHTVLFMRKIRLKHIPSPHTRSARKLAVWSMAFLIPYTRLNGSFTYLSRANSPCNENNNPSSWHSALKLKKHFHLYNFASSSHHV